jgi:hypothetical protein
VALGDERSDSFHSFTFETRASIQHPMSGLVPQRAIRHPKLPPALATLKAGVRVLTGIVALNTGATNPNNCLARAKSGPALQQSHMIWQWPGCRKYADGKPD